MFRITLLSLLVFCCFSQLQAKEGDSAANPPQPYYGAFQVDGKGFWYRQLNKGGQEFRFVNLDTRKDELLLNHQAVAQALGKELRTTVLPEQLNLSHISVSRDFDWVRFRTLGRRWHFNPSTGSLRGLPDDIDPDPILPTPAPVTTDDASDANLIFRNTTQEEAICYWISDDGSRRSYGKVLPGESREQHTYATHHWLVETVTGYPLAQVVAKGGKQEVPLVDPSAGLWTSQMDGKTVQLHHPKLQPDVRITLENSVPGQIRSNGSGAMVALAVATEQLWKFYAINQGAATEITVTR